MDTFVERFQPELYNDWKNGVDNIPHPEETIRDFKVKCKE